jgi:hypothetical protein
MAKLSDFQVPDAPIEVCPELMKRNAEHAGDSVDWLRTPIKVTGLADGVNNPFTAASKQIARSIAVDARADRLHRALDEAIDEMEVSDDEPLEPAVSEQKDLGGGCGRSFACDRTELSPTSLQFVRPNKKRMRVI